MGVASRQFQKQRLIKVMNLAGPRYEKEVNVDVSIRSAFHALIKSQQFINLITDTTYRFSEAGQYIGNEHFYAVSNDHYKEIRKLKLYVVSRLRSINTASPDKGFRIYSVVHKIRQMQLKIDELIKLLEAADSEKKIKLPKDSHQSVKSEVNNLYELVHASYEVSSLLEGYDFSAYIKKSFLLKGEAGIGKTHLLCDFANEAYALGHPVYIFLGEEFVGITDPLKRICAILDDANSLNTINEEAKKKGKRAIILIDAVNEAQVKVNWDIMQSLAKYRYLTFVMSIRNGYEDAVLSSKLQSGIHTMTHNGINANNLANIESFFSHFEVPMPDVPLISREFSNPLFVKIFCRTYERKKTVRGDIGSTTLFEDYVRKQSNQVKRAAGLPNDTHLWRIVIKPFAEWMGQNATGRILSKKAHEIIEAALPGKSVILLQEMERHWLLTKVPHYTKGGKVSGHEYRFPYQRFSDHLIVRYLLNHHLKRTGDPKSYFAKHTPLGRILSPLYPWHIRSGLIEAMAIQVPERLEGVELIDVASAKFKRTSTAESSFLNSLLWRDLEMRNGAWRYFDKLKIIKHINFYARGNATRDGFDAVLMTVLSTAGIANHPLDAEILHAFLSKRTMPKRDEFWIPFLYYQYGEDGSVIDRYLNWTSSKLVRKLKSKQVILQTGIVLSWLLASSHRELRDRATKSLVNLLDGRYAIIKELLQKFDGVDDLYILERLYAVAYGCALRETRPSKLKTLALYIYDLEFSKNSPKINILLRDYARGVVELYHRYDPSVKFDEKNYKPPYSSTFPERIISKKTIEKKYPRAADDDKSYSSIEFSVQANVGDFGRYVIESNLHSFMNVKLDGTAPESEKDRCDAILKSLNASQKKLVDAIRGDPLSQILAIRIISNSAKQMRWPSEKHDGAKAKNDWKELKKTLTLSKNDEKILKKYLKGDHLRDNSMFDTIRGSRWIFDRAVKFGWDPALHGSFDRNIARNNYDRHKHKIERIGKKYQWLALYEFMARVADNFRVIERDGGVYNGPWQMHLRNIDPTHTLIKAGADTGDKMWWQKIDYDNWRLDISEKDWLQLDDIPDLRQLIATKDSNGKSWLSLNTHYGNKQRLEHIPQEKQYNFRRREIWLMLKSYIIRKKDLKTFMQWAATGKDFRGSWMPESHAFYSAFYREFPNQPAFVDQYSEYYGRTDWYKKSSKVPFDVMVTNDEFTEESSGYDHSLHEGFGIMLPARKIYIDMDVRSSNVEGQYKNYRNEVVFLDPHIKDDGRDALLASATHFSAYLKKNNYALIWTVIGEKQILDGGLGRDKNWPGRYEFSGAYYLDATTLQPVGDLYMKVHKTNN